MRVLIQRVERACVRVDDVEVGAIGLGYLLLVGVQIGDSQAQVDQAVRKLLNLRLFQDAQGKTNLNISQAGGAALVVSQFTLAANLKNGNRPSFDSAAPANLAQALYQSLADGLKNQ